LPGSQAEYAHPDVTNYKPVYRGKTDPRYLQIKTWMGQVLQPVEPDYGIDFPVPGMSDRPATTKATSQPASAPAPAPPTSKPLPKPPPAPPVRPMRPVTPPAPR
jgi:hypothetical protein